MPTYEYLCRECGTRLEVVQSFNDDSLTVCDDCGGELRKVFSAAGLIFKGSGWHIKDYSGAGAPTARGSSETGGERPAKATDSSPSAPAERGGEAKKADATPPAPASGSASSSSSSGTSATSGSD